MKQLVKRQFSAIAALAIPDQVYSLRIVLAILVFLLKFYLVYQFSQLISRCYEKSFSMCLLLPKIIACNANIIHDSLFRSPWRWFLYCYWLSQLVSIFKNSVIFLDTFYQAWFIFFTAGLYRLVLALHQRIIYPLWLYACFLLGLVVQH